MVFGPRSRKVLDGPVLPRLSPRQFSKRMTALRREGADPVRADRWSVETRLWNRFATEGPLPYGGSNPVCRQTTG
ncbi:hypothetical protein GCM10009863_10770 [Streptomyces axinellae]|uniref:Uncharacterized protein n=1 Tax=Streptomyces axinellae TaxID=552788 RepID=A0ABN3PRL7_9ACTN